MATESKQVISSSPTAAARRVSQPWSASLLDRYDTFIFDCDGVLWLGDTMVTGADHAIAALRKRGKRVLFVTNNSSKSRQQYLTTLTSMGFHGVVKDEVLSSSFAAAARITNLPASTFDRTVHKVAIVGDVGIGAELKEAGIQYIEANQVVGTGHLPKEELVKLATKLDPQVRAVVVGLDNKFTYSKCAWALFYLTRVTTPPTIFISTNQDETFPVSGGELPGAGTAVAAIRTASGKTPLNCGKPDPFMLSVAVQRFKLDTKRTIMVGDRLDTDIQFGINGGIDTLLVLTGVTNHDVACSPTNPSPPSFILDTVANIATTAAPSTRARL